MHRVIRIGIIYTRYGNTDGEEIKFGVDKFGHKYDDADFPPDTATDFNDILEDEIGDVFRVIRQTKTRDDMGNVVDIATDSVWPANLRIHAYIQDISKRDREVHEMGLAVPGNRMVYMCPEYQFVSGGVATEYSIKEGDILLDRNNQRWRVIKILQGPYIEQTQIYKKAVVQSVHLEGTD